MTKPHKVQFVIGGQHRGLRLDQVLALEIPELSRRKARVLLEIGGVFVDRARVKIASRAVHEGQVVEVTLGAALEQATPSGVARARAQGRGTLPEPDIVLEDAAVLVVNKASGVLVAPTQESDQNTLLTQLQQRDRSAALHLVHRLDRETSGLLVFAKGPRAAAALSVALQAHKLQRRYWAVLDGVGSLHNTQVSVPVAGKAATTYFESVETVVERVTVVTARLQTGRTHQIRAHAAHLGHPVCGDRRYGADPEQGAPRLALHAQSLGFSHPDTGQEVILETPPPEDLRLWLEQVRAGTCA